MKNILITGANGFIGKNLICKLNEKNRYEVISFTTKNNIEELSSYVRQTDFIIHLAGVNRTNQSEDYYKGNIDLINEIVELLKKHKKNVPILMTSSIQVELDNDYGKSKLMAEKILTQYHKETNAPIYLYRLPNVFGKWGKPNYNSVIATLCYNTSRNLETKIFNKDTELNLVYIDEVVNEFIEKLESDPKADSIYHSIPIIFKKKLTEIVSLINEFKSMRETLLIPDLSDGFTKRLYATYLSYLDEQNFAYPLEQKKDHRGWLAEIVKSAAFGQMFVSKTAKGIIRGNHYHHTKVEKFLVIQGEAIIRFRNINEKSIIEIKVSGNDPKMVDIPPGYTHSIENTGNVELITLFWANEIFDQENQDTYFDEVNTFCTS